MSTKIICPNCQNPTHPMALSCPKCQHTIIKNEEDNIIPGNSFYDRFKILFHPKYVTRQRVPQISNLQANFWIGLAGATALMADAIEPIIGEKARFVDVTSIAKSAAVAFGIGALIGIVGLFILSHLIRWIGKRMDIISNAKDVRAMFALSTPPIFLWAATVLSQWLVYYPNYFQTNQFLQHIPGNIGIWWVTSGINIISVLCLLWFIVFLVIGLAEIGNSLIWSSLATLTISMLIVGGILMIVLYVQLIRLLHSF